MKRDVSAQIDLDITDPTVLEFQISVAPHSGAQVSESLSFRLDGKPIQATEILGAHGSRIHKFEAGVGNLQASYEATVVGTSAPPPVDDYDLSMYLRPSRYAEADKFFGFAATEFGNFTGASEATGHFAGASEATGHFAASATLLAKVSSWVGARLDYVPGSSDPIDGATDTLLAGAGVCRDYAHLVIALLRAVNVPARLVAVYPPGCDPMDFHAVAEAYVEGGWRVVDATCLAPRSSLVRISTGRDAADTAFLDNHGGAITLNNVAVTAVVDGDLPDDDITELVSLG